MEIGIHQVRTHLSKLIALVERGERVVILKYGKPVAELVPAARQSPADVSAAVESLALLRASLIERNATASSAEIRQWIDEGRH